MLIQLALLPLLAVTVTGVTSEAHDGDVIIDVATSEPVPARAARPMTGHSLLYVFVDGATADREVFDNGDHPSRLAPARAIPSWKFPWIPACAAANPRASRPRSQGCAYSSLAARARACPRRRKPRMECRRSAAKPPSLRLEPPRKNYWPLRWLCPRGRLLRPRRKLKKTSRKQPSRWPKPSPASNPQPCLLKQPSRRCPPSPRQRRSRRSSLPGKRRSRGHRRLRPRPQPPGRPQLPALQLQLTTPLLPWLRSPVPAAAVHRWSSPSSCWRPWAAAR